MLRRLVVLLGGRPRGCSCDWRFVGVASDVDCPIHGLSAALRAQLTIVDAGGAPSAGADGSRRRQHLLRRWAA